MRVTTLVISKNSSTRSIPWQHKVANHADAINLEHLQMIQTLYVHHHLHPSPDPPQVAWIRTTEPSSFSAKLLHTTSGAKRLPLGIPLKILLTALRPHHKRTITGHAYNEPPMICMGSAVLFSKTSCPVTTSSLPQPRQFAKSFLVV